MKDQKRFVALALSAVMVFSMAGGVSAAQKVESKDNQMHQGHLLNPKMILQEQQSVFSLVQQVTLMHLIMRKMVLQ